MDYLDIESAILVGMSQGGYCALRAALVAPHRVNALVLMSTRSEVDEKSLQNAYREMRDTWHQMGPIPPLVEGIATALLGPRENPEIEKHWQHWLPKWQKVPGHNIFHAMNNLLERDEIEHRLKEITCPAMVIHGSEDSAIPPAVGEVLSKKLINCKDFVVAPGAHAVNLTNATIINPPLIRFIKDIYG
jgi:pimeloyl-ACP methyl ester carboxylesterase